MSTSGLATPQPHPLLPAWGLRQHALLVAELLCAAILCRLLAFAEGLPPHPQPSLLGGGVDLLELVSRPPACM